MVCVCIGKDSPRHGLYGDVILDLDGDTELGNGTFISFHAFICDSIKVGVSSEPLGNLPQFDSFVCIWRGNDTNTTPFFLYSAHHSPALTVSSEKEEGGP